MPLLGMAFYMSLDVQKGKMLPKPFGREVLQIPCKGKIQPIHLCKVTM